MKHAIGLGLLLFFGFVATSRASVFQYAVDAKNDRGDSIRAYLWVPPGAERIRGVLIGGQILMEEHFVADKDVRLACADEQLAIIYFASHVAAVFEPEKSSKPFLAAISKLADVSGYQELKVAPWLPFGHSVASLYARNIAYWKPERCFGVFCQKGGGPSAPDWSDRKILEGIPILVLKGQFEEFGPGPSGVLRDFETREVSWQSMYGGLTGIRKDDPRWLVSLLVDPGASHMTWPATAGKPVGRFIRRAAQLRIPDWPVDAKSPPELIPLDPASGVLSVGSLEKPKNVAAADYKGDMSKTLWHMDAELADAIEAFHQGMSKRPQFVTFVDPKSGNPMNWGHDLRMRINPYWVGPDTLKVATGFVDSPPPKYPAIRVKAGHAPGPIRIRVFSGPLEPAGDGIFRVMYQPRGRGRPSLLAYHLGDNSYRAAEQPAFIQFKGISSGEGQKITFSKVGRITARSRSVKLQAKSDSGLPVRFVVESGPAVVRGDRLELTDVPKRAKFPMQIRIVAYQVGSAIEPKYKSADPVVQVIEVTER